MAKLSSKNANSRARGGFSLFELLIVVVILGVLATMVGPATSRIVALSVAPAIVMPLGTLVVASQVAPESSVRLRYTSKEPARSSRQTT